MLKSNSGPTTNQMTGDHMKRKIPWRLAYEEQKPINESIPIDLFKSEQYQKLSGKKLKSIDKDLNFYVAGFCIPKTPLNPLAILRKQPSTISPCPVMLSYTAVSRIQYIVGKCQDLENP